MNSTQMPIDLTELFLDALQQAASMTWGIHIALPRWALLLLGLLVIFRLVRPELRITPATSPCRRRTGGRRAAMVDKAIDNPQPADVPSPLPSTPERIPT